MTEDMGKIGDDLDFKWNVQQHILSINRLSTKITEEGGITNFTVAIKTLAMLMIPYVDRYYQMEYKKLKATYDKEKGILNHPYNKKPMKESLYRILELNLALDHYGILVKLMDRLNLLFETEMTDIIDEDEYGKRYRKASKKAS